jgi:hypothetical protein
VKDSSDEPAPVVLATTLMSYAVDGVRPVNTYPGSAVIVEPDAGAVA